MKYSIILVLAALLLSTCVKRPGDIIEPFEHKGLSAICIIDESPLREEPVLESELVTSLYLGDEFIFVGDIETDMFSEYYRIELYDGTTGWLLKDAVLFNARHAAVINKTTIYPELDSRNDSQVTLYPSEYIAIVKENGGWVKVLSAGRKKGGWIKRENISTSEEDIFIATLAYTDLLNEEGVIRSEQLPSFIHSLPNKNTQLAIYLQEVLKKKIADAIAISIIEYEIEKYEED